MIVFFKGCQQGEHGMFKLHMNFQYSSNSHMKYCTIKLLKEYLIEARLTKNM